MYGVRILELGNPLCACVRWVFVADMEEAREVIDIWLAKGDRRIDQNSFLIKKIS